MLMDPHPSQHHAGLHYAVWQLQQEVNRPKARFKPIWPEKSISWSTPTWGRAENSFTKLVPGRRLKLLVRRGGPRGQRDLHHGGQFESLQIHFLKIPMNIFGHFYALAALYLNGPSYTCPCLLSSLNWLIKLETSRTVIIPGYGKSSLV